MSKHAPMTEIDELNRRLDEHSSILLNDSREFARVSREAVEARNAYDLARAKALLTIKDGTVDIKKAEATLLCEVQMLDARIKEAHVEALKMRLRAVSESLTAVQTRARLLKTESELDRYQT